MKRLFLLSVTILLLGPQLSAQQISNAGFEHWNIGTIQEPDSFFSFDQFIPLNTTIRTSQAHSGQYAALLNTVNSGSDALPGVIIYTGPGAPGSTGWSFTGRPDKFRFWYKFNRQGTDTGIGIIWLKKNGATIGQGVFFITSTTTAYTQAVATIQYANSQQPDSIVVEFSSGFGNGPFAVGTQLHVDDISLDYPAAVSDPESPEVVHLYPNPVEDVLTISLPGSGISGIVIADATGKLIYQNRTAGASLQVDCSGWSEGLYIATIKNGASVYVRKITRSN